MGLELGGGEGFAPESPGPTPWEPFHREVDRQVFITKGLLAIPTSGEVTRVQKELMLFIFSSFKDSLNLIKK